MMILKGVATCLLYTLQAMAFFTYKREIKKIDKNNPHNSIVRYLMAIELWVFMLLATAMIHNLAS